MSEPRDRGICGAAIPSVFGRSSLVCELLDGHAGWHHSRGCDWGTPVPARSGDTTEEGA